MKKCIIFATLALVLLSGCTKEPEVEPQEVATQQDKVPEEKIEPVEIIENYVCKIEVPVDDIQSQVTTEYEVKGSFVTKQKTTVSMDVSPFQGDSDIPVEDVIAGMNLEEFYDDNEYPGITTTAFFEGTIFTYVMSTDFEIASADDLVKIGLFNEGATDFDRKLSWIGTLMSAKQEGATCEAVQ
ncbi:hypothetical protein [Erysipelothrix anatis]|uniref:hypothetical protein n=1 Tax=Erysipelothrix anatis TaxID=2683713 RepID=UPI00135CBA95|nr:hypothetical protein [Erysipelothrix anatis]